MPPVAWRSPRFRPGPMALRPTVTRGLPLSVAPTLVGYLGRKRLSCFLTPATATPPPTTPVLYNFSTVGGREPLTHQTRSERLNGGDVWESNPPEPPKAPPNGFEDRASHQAKSAPENARALVRGN